MAQHKSRRSSDASQDKRPHDKKLLREAKSWLIEQLEARGVAENPRELTVCLPRKSRAHLVGWYSYMSQFRRRARITVDVPSIRSEMCDDEAICLEVRMTCAHEYGHMVAELLEVLKGQSPMLADLSSRWTDRFAGDEEGFAEDLARHLAMKGQANWTDWEAFLVDLGTGLQEVLQ